MGRSALAATPPGRPRQSAPTAGGTTIRATRCASGATRHADTCGGYRQPMAQAAGSSGTARHTATRRTGAATPWRCEAASRLAGGRAPSGPQCCRADGDFGAHGRCVCRTGPARSSRGCRGASTLSLAPPDDGRPDWPIDGRSMAGRWPVDGRSMDGRWLIDGRSTGRSMFARWSLDWPLDGRMTGA